MYLLSPTPTKEGDEDEGFTFHYVSIKSPQASL